MTLAPTPLGGRRLVGTVSRRLHTLRAVSPRRPCPWLQPVHLARNTNSTFQVSAWLKMTWRTVNSPNHKGVTALMAVASHGQTEVACACASWRGVSGVSGVSGSDTAQEMPRAGPLEAQHALHVQAGWGGAGWRRGGG